MKSFGNIELMDGTNPGLKNVIVNQGSALPITANSTNGELFYLNTGDAGLYIYSDGEWQRTSYKATDYQRFNKTGWRDITADLNVKGSGGTSPTWNAMYGGMWGWRFSNNTAQECFFNFHINHDYLLGSPVFLHIHWTNCTAPINTGTVRWGFEYSIAKGHGQEVFPATTFVYVEQVCDTTNKHMVAEILNGITSNSLEPDAIIMCRVFRDAAHANDTCIDNVFALTADLHYQCDRHSTKNRSPNFYT